MAMLDDALTDLRQTIAASATRSRSKIALSARLRGERVRWATPQTASSGPPHPSLSPRPAAGEG